MTLSCLFAICCFRALISAFLPSASSPGSEAGSLAAAPVAARAEEFSAGAADPEEEGKAGAAEFAGGAAEDEAAPGAGAAGAGASVSLVMTTAGFEAACFS